LELREASGGLEMKRYAIIIEKARKNYAAFVPDLPGCIATGKTLEETKRHMREAIALHIESIREHGEIVPEPTTTVDFAEVA
jgi:predicted RNase H-like HicB family nuclease